MENLENGAYINSMPLIKQLTFSMKSKPSENQIKNLLKKIENYNIYDLDNKKLTKIDSIKSKLFDV